MHGKELCPPDVMWLWAATYVIVKVYSPIPRFHSKTVVIFSHNALQLLVDFCICLVWTFAEAHWLLLFWVVQHYSENLPAFSCSLSSSGAQSKPDNWHRKHLNSRHTYWWYFHLVFTSNHGYATSLEGFYILALYHDILNTFICFFLICTIIALCKVFLPSWVSKPSRTM